jgi:hypothetical protein
MALRVRAVVLQVIGLPSSRAKAPNLASELPMSEIPIDEKTFDLACKLYSHRGGMGEPVLSHSIVRQTDGKRYSIIRSDNRNDLATYRIDFNFESDEPSYSLTDPEWPEPSYSLDPRDHIHALGVISANYSLLENTLGHFFRQYTNLPQQTSLNLFAKLGNELRITTITDALKESNHPAEIKDGIEYFLRAFRTIFIARNILMHASPLGQPTYPDLEPLQIPITLEKRTKKSPARFQLYEPTLSSLRGIADSARAFRAYGSRLSAHIMCHYEKNQLEEILAKQVDKSSRQIALDSIQELGHALPDKPPQPTPLTPHSAEAPEAPPSPPESSQRKPHSQ